MEKLKLAAQQALDALRANGADVAACTAVTTRMNEFNVDSGEFTLMRTVIDDSLALTGFAAGRKGTTAINALDADAIAGAAADCMAAAQSAEPDSAWEIASEGHGDFTDGEITPDLDRFFDRCNELKTAITERHPTILIQQMILQHIRTDTVYANSHGVRYTGVEGAYLVSIGFCAQDGDVSSSLCGSELYTLSLDTPFIEQGTIERDLCSAELQVHPVPFSGKEVCPVILSPDCFRSLLSHLFGNFVSDSALLDGTSLWKTQLGAQVADPRITLTVAAQHPQLATSQRWTGEGYASENYDILREGKLMSFQLSQYAANRTGLTRAANTASTCFVMAPGEGSLDDLFARVGHGLYVQRFSGGNPSTNGDFSGVAKNSFRIENGKLSDAASEVMISGNLADLLRNVIHITAETANDGTSVLPWIAFNGITVSGR
jgi:PmbA protein